MCKKACSLWVNDGGTCLFTYPHDSKGNKPFDTMLQPCYLHVMPLLRPYGQRGAHLGTSTHKNQQFLQNFDFDNCDVAKYLIGRDNSSALTNRNGVPTELAKHATSCDKCKLKVQSEIQIRENEPHKHKTQMIEFDTDILSLFEKWKSKNAPSQRFDQCVLLLIKEIAFWRSEDKLRKKGKTK